MIELIIGILIGICLVPILLSLVPSNLTRHNFNLKSAPTHKLSSFQIQTLRKSMHVCTDLFWLNIIISRLWIEFTNSSAQAYRFRGYLKENLYMLRGNNLIRDIEILDIAVSSDSPTIESVQIVDSNTLAQLIRNSKKLYKTQEFLSKKRENTETDYENIYKHLQAVVAIEYLGIIKIKLSVLFPKNVSLQVTVYINKIKGQLLLRFPSLEYNSRLEYSFLTNPELEIGIEAGLSKNKSTEYFKKSVSNLCRRTIKYAIVKLFVYPSFNNIIIPFIASKVRSCNHFITKISVNGDDKSIDFLKNSLNEFIAMEYKLHSVFDGITLRKNNLLLNNKEKVIVSHFRIPDIYFNIGSISYCNKSSLMKFAELFNLIYDLSILKNVITAFQKITILKKLNDFCSIIELEFKNVRYEFIRILSNESVYFQRNDEKNPDFFIFRIYNTELFIYSFITTNTYAMTQKRLVKMKKILEKNSENFIEKKNFSIKPSKKNLGSKLYNYSKKMFGFLGYSSIKKKKELIDLSFEEMNFEKFYKTCEIILKRYQMEEPVVSYMFDCSIDTIFSIVYSDQIRLKLISSKLKIIKVHQKSDAIKSVLVEQETIENGIVNTTRMTFYTYMCIFTIIDVIDNLEIIYKFTKITNDENLKLKCQPTVVLNENQSYLQFSKSETDIVNCKKKNILFKNENPNAFENEELSKINLSSSLQRTKTRVCVFVNDKTKIQKDNIFYETVYIKLIRHKYHKLVKTSNYEKLELKKELRKDILGNVGGVYIEFRTDTPDEFHFYLESQNQKRSILEISRVCTSSPFHILIPMYSEDIFLLRLVPKYRKNGFIDIKVCNFSKINHPEAFIDCTIILSKNKTFRYPITGNPKFMFYWDREFINNVSASIENPYTKVSLSECGIMRTEEVDYLVKYKNKSRKKKELKLFLGLALA